MGFLHKQGLRYYQFDIFEEYPIFHAVLTRQGGYSQKPYDTLNTGGTVGDDPKAVLANHQRIYEILDYDYQSRFDVWQVHGTDIVCTDVARNPEDQILKADGIMTDNPSITLFMRFADCVPILLFDPVRKVIGIVHAGWQGTQQMIGKIAVERMQARYGSAPEDLVAGIGPSICQGCYEVGSDVHQSFIQSFGRKAQAYFRVEETRLYLDLWAANRDSLKMAGVKKIEIAGICTACHLADWYSHRAENGKTGRFGVILSLQNQ
jgi:YfiH family protein